LKYEESNLIHIQTNDNLVILTDKTDTLITLQYFLRNVKKVMGAYTKGQRDYISSYTNFFTMLNYTLMVGY